MERIAHKQITFNDLLFGNSFKKDLLFFDKILINKESFFIQKSIAEYLSKIKQGLPEQLSHNLNEIEFLLKEEFVFLVEPIKTLEGVTKQDNEIKEFLKLIKEIEKIKEEFTKILSTHQNEIEGIRMEVFALKEFDSFLIRKFCSIIEDDESGYLIPQIKNFNLNLFEVMLDSNKLEYKPKIKKANILQIVLKEIPTPQDDVSWEEILDFKENSDLKFHRNGFHVWINDIANSKLSEVEIMEKYKYLLNSYEDRMKKEKIKYKLATTELFVTAPMKIIENFVKLNWSENMKLFFALKKRKLDLLISETKAPGKELAFVSKAKKQFNRKNELLSNTNKM